jgi:hypothetical protein
LWTILIPGGPQKIRASPTVEVDKKVRGGPCNFNFYPQKEKPRFLSFSGCSAEGAPMERFVLASALHIDVCVCVRGGCFARAADCTNFIIIILPAAQIFIGEAQIALIVCKELKCVSHENFLYKSKRYEQRCVAGALHVRVLSGAKRQN